MVLMCIYIGEASRTRAGSPRFFLLLQKRRIIVLEQNRIPIADMAVMLRVTREVAIRMVQRGVLRGGQDEGGRWYADKDNVRRAKQQERDHRVPVPA